jgi:hypothetical protein
MPIAYAEAIALFQRYNGHRLQLVHISYKSIDGFPKSVCFKRNALWHAGMAIAAFKVYGRRLENFRSLLQVFNPFFN